MTKTLQELAELNRRMLADTETCPSVPLQDNTIAIQEHFNAALMMLVARIQSEVSSLHEELERNNPRADGRKAPLIRAEQERNGFIRIVMTQDYASEEERAFAGMIAEDARAEGRARKIVDNILHKPFTVGFVEAGTGLLWKAATKWAPALNYARGCIFNLDEIPGGQFERGTFDLMTTKISLDKKQERS